MKILFFVLGVASTITASASHIPDQLIECRLNSFASSELVDRKLRENPQAVGRTGDYGGIFVSEVDGFSVKFQNGDVSGTLKFGETTENMELSNKDFSRKIDSFGLVEKNHIQVEVNSSGWDNNNYKFTIDPKESSAKLKEFLDYDCGGDGSHAYAVYSCTTKAL